jgi:hypothetical protein
MSPEYGVTYVSGRTVNNFQRSVRCPWCRLWGILWGPSRDWGISLVIANPKGSQRQCTSRGASADVSLGGVTGLGSRVSIA